MVKVECDIVVSRTQQWGSDVLKGERAVASNVEGKGDCLRGGGLKMQGRTNKGVDQASIKISIRESRSPLLRARMQS
jgi:hypothetical protein